MSSEQSRPAHEGVVPLPPAGTPDAPDDASAVLRADGLGMRTHVGWVFRHVDLRADAGEVVEVRGSGGTGRSMLLLTLAGRARPSVGTLRVLGHDLPRGSRAVRRRSAVARLDRVIGPEEHHTVRMTFRERARWERVHPPGSDGLGYRVDEVRELTGLVADPDVHVEGLPAVQRTLLAVALAALPRPELLVLDDLDDGLPPDEQALVWEALTRVADADGCVVLASTAGDPRTPAPDDPPRTVLELHPTHVEES
ncbi:ATP-binding cassette domain-containing protein [Cellulomonas sp. ES6]|uniref:ATP-binding cassette domain-containing protein n=1 Tax=Cellulomonas sp. ES6 TaxID=3039384 RepID=UPI0024B85E91|nr:ATP-binding cassette domain-containing protein [Cellulomonas sp. ES6]WHP18941.1 ATP-binding cassette domain-containing protein [Cellulomonas sp. ES6]